MSDPYAQLIIGGRKDQMTQKLKKRHFKQKKDYAAWVKQMRAQGYIVDATQTAYKETKDGELDEVMSYDQFKAGKKLKDKTALQETRTLLDSQNLTARATEKLIGGKADVKDLRIANADAFANGAETAQFDPNIAGVLGTELYQTHGGVKLDKPVGSYNEGDAEFRTDAGSLTEGKAEEAVTEKSYEDIINMKRGKKRDELTIEHWEKQGYKFKGLRKDQRRELANDLRIGHAAEHTGSKGSFIHFKGFRGSGRTFKKNEV